MMIYLSARVKTILLIMVCGALLFVSASVSASSQADLDSQINQISNHVRFMRHLIAMKGSPRSISADAKVDFVATPSILPFASAQTRQDGRGRIQISSQFRLLLVYFTELNILLSEMPELGDCLINYREMVEKTHQANMYKENTATGNIDDIPSPERYAIAMDPKCFVLQERLPLREDQRGLRNYQVNLAIAFTYFHELGHLSLGHKPLTDDVFRGVSSEEDKRKVFIDSMKFSREQEHEADRWAVQEMMFLNAHPLELVTPGLLDMIIATSGIDCRLRLIMTHPDPVARIANIVIAIRREAAFRNGAKVHAEVDQFFSDLLAFRRKVERILECPEEEAIAQ
jgi:hypothetical protein